MPQPYTDMASASNSRDPDAYQYSPLPQRGNWVRILYLEPAQSKGHDIVIRLKEVNLDLKTRPRMRSGHLDGAGQVALGGIFRPSYEALSWSWGSKTPTERISIHGDEAHEQYKGLHIPKNLGQALRALREPNKIRLLWTDGICINMEDKTEQAEQVAKMDVVYTEAENVCVWLEEGLGHSQYLDCTLDELRGFIRSELMELKDFHKVITSDDYAHKWFGLVRLMTKKWFSRRWIIQEIVLARRATIHCGHINIDWRYFEHAVSLFIKAELAGHHISKLLEKDERFVKRGLLWDIDRMGACSLVEITTANFRRSVRGISVPASSLETLMAKLPMFESTDPVDSVYALLGIATDTSPETETSKRRMPDLATIRHFTAHRGLSIDEQKTMVARALRVARMFATGRRSKPYTVSYVKHPVEVYKEFVEFCIYRSRSLDIILRPWAPKPEAGTESNSGIGSEFTLFDDAYGAIREEDTSLPTSIENATPPEEYEEEWLRGMESVLETTFHDDLTPASSPIFGEPVTRKRSFGQMNGPGPTSGVNGQNANAGISKKTKTAISKISVRTPGETDINIYDRLVSQIAEMPSWISDRSQIPFTLLTMDESVKSIERKNADPLVGSPDNRFYSASGKLPVRTSEIQFRSRGNYDHSLFVEGFVLFEVAAAEQHADLSNIPIEWFDFVGHRDRLRLFRTMIADRGPNGGRAPPYFLSAFLETFKDRQTTLETKDIMHGSNSFMNEFLSRVRQVTFNRRLIKTGAPKRGHESRLEAREHASAAERPLLGLAPKPVRQRLDEKPGTGDLVCILYGLSVPVILKKCEKTPEEKRQDHRIQQAQLPEAFRRAVRAIEEHWSFCLALKDAIIALKYRHWRRYEAPGKDDLLPSWRSSIRHKFPQLWLAQIDQDERRRQGGLPPEQIYKVPRVGTVKEKTRLDPNLTKDGRDQLWQEMSQEWDKWVKNAANRDFVARHKCKAYDAEVKSPEEYYKVVGECYIEEMMDGQALDYKQRWKVKDQIFELR